MDGDEGDTEAQGATERYGLDVDVARSPTAWLTVDANLELAHASFVANAGIGGAGAFAPRVMGGGGITLRGRGRARAPGPRPRAPLRPTMWTRSPPTAT